MPYYQEHLMQEAIVRYVKFNYPSVVFTCAPANAKNVMQGVRNKRMGYSKGWPDLFFAEPRKGFYGLFIELKTDKGSVKTEQRTLLEDLGDKGYKTRVCRSYDEAINEIDNYLK